MLDHQRARRLPRRIQFDTSHPFRPPHHTPFDTNELIEPPHQWPRQSARITITAPPLILRDVGYMVNQPHPHCLVIHHPPICPLYGDPDTPLAPSLATSSPTHFAHTFTHPRTSSPHHNRPTHPTAHSNTMTMTMQGRRRKWEPQAGWCQRRGCGMYRTMKYAGMWRTKPHQSPQVSTPPYNLHHGTLTNVTPSTSHRYLSNCEDCKCSW